MSEIQIACIVGARPNFMKMAPILRAMANKPGLHATLIHTGQHYDANLSDVFFSQLGMQTPDVHLGVRSGTHAQQTARVLEKIEAVFAAGPAVGQSFDRVLVVGDVNSTLATTLAATKLHLPVAHVEAGLRSRDRSMPEEINRLMTDAVADMLFVSEPDGVANLLAEGHDSSSVHLVGNVMIDTLLHQVEAARSLNFLQELGVSPSEFALVTLHRPSNVDHPEVLEKLVDALVGLSGQLPIVFPVHPRTVTKITEFDLFERLEQAQGIYLLPPVGCREFLCFSSQAKVIVTDSGGLQEESTALGIPCLTLRTNTERPITVTEGTNTLVGQDLDLLNQQFQAVLKGVYKQGRCPELWDGKASERIIELLSSEHGA